MVGNPRIQRNGPAVPYSLTDVAVDSPGSEWTHVNSAQRLPNGNTIVSLRNLDLVVEVNPKGDVVWTYGALVLKHQHCPFVGLPGASSPAFRPGGSAQQVQDADFREGCRSHTQD